MKRILFSSLIAGFLFTSLAMADTKIGLIIPIEHQAMTEIVKGFEMTLTKSYHAPVTFKIANAQNDPNLEHAIIQEMRDDNDYAMIVPIGTDATQMAVSMIKQKPIVSLAANLSEAERQKLNPCQVAVVHDEIANTKIFEFIHQVYPQITQVALPHSAADKVFSEVSDAETQAKKLGITIKPVMAQTLPDLQPAIQSLPDNIQAIFVLKDNLMASGITQLVALAAKRHIPLITSDDGSVEDGAGFALGVQEKEIGIEGAHLAVSILNGQKACDLPIQEMTHLSVFINKKAMQTLGQSVQPVTKAAQKMGYHVVFVGK